MVSKNRIGKIAVASLAAGVFAVAGLGVASPASADDGGGPGGPPGAQRGVDAARRVPRPNGPQLAPMPGNRAGPGPQNQGGPNQGPPNANRPAMQQPGLQSGPGPLGNRPAMQQAPRPGVQAPNPAQNAEAVRAKGIIAASAEVLGVQPAAVLAGLEQGQTLAQVASVKGMTRDYFLTELVNQIEKDIKDGQRFGIAATPDLRTQIANLLEEPGLGIRGAALSARF